MPVAVNFQHGNLLQRSACPVGVRFSLWGFTPTLGSIPFESSVVGLDGGRGKSVARSWHRSCAAGGFEGGTGALCSAILDRCSPSFVSAVEPSEGFLSTAAQRLAGRAVLQRLW